MRGGKRERERERERERGVGRERERCILNMFKKSINLIRARRHDRVLAIARRFYEGRGNEIYV